MPGLAQIEETLELPLLFLAQIAHIGVETKHLTT